MFVKHLDIIVMSTTEKLCQKWVIMYSEQGMNSNQQLKAQDHTLSNEKNTRYWIAVH